MKSPRLISAAAVIIEWTVPLNNQHKPIYCSKAWRIEIAHNAVQHQSSVDIYCHMRITHILGCHRWGRVWRRVLWPRFYEWMLNFSCIFIWDRVTIWCEFWFISKHEAKYAQYYAYGVISTSLELRKLRKRVIICTKYAQYCTAADNQNLLNMLESSLSFICWAGLLTIQLLARLESKSHNLRAILRIYSLALYQKWTILDHCIMNNIQSNSSNH
jgi:hypothetical protein